MKPAAVVTLLLTVSALRCHAQEVHTEDSDYYYGEPCQHENFYCDYDDPSIFYRCIDGVYHTFHCPSGLHFSSAMQTCDWPHAADCANSEGEGSHGAEESAHTGGQDEVKVVSHGEENSIKSEVVEASSSWIHQAAAAGKSWWRPEGISSGQWSDPSSVKKPAFQPHTPDKPKPKPEETAPKKAEETEPKKSDATAPKKPEETKSPSKSTSAASSSASIDRQDASSVQWNEGSCSSSCQLPSCYCAGTDIPHGLPASSVPQMVMITFDDEVSGAFYGYYQRLFRPGRYNPNGCPVRGCLYVSGSGTEYDLVHPLYSMGIEIASHTISHRFPHTWWANASYQEFVEEAAGMRDNLITQAGLPREAIKGFRVPFLQIGADNMYSAIYDSKFVYDTSMFTGNQWEGGEPVWPFTLDYVPNESFCQHGPCPTKQYPGMWEIPVQRWYGLDGHSCAMPDGCSSTGDAEETLEYLKSNFRRFYGSNRAPFGIFVHARWFQTEHNLEGLDMFIDYLLTLDDVYFVTPSQVIEWMKEPTSLSEINGFGPWSCEGAAKDVWTEKEE